jgi:hypothetical protein
VKEPSGTVCSSQLRLSPGGGTLIGGDLASQNKVSYVAARAFPGEYEVKIKRLWGQPLGGKFRLEVIRNQGTANEERTLETVTIEQAHAFKLSLKNGRRTELAAVPPPGALEQPAKQEAKQVHPLQKLRQIADPEFSVYRGGIKGAVGAPAAARPQQFLDLAASKQSERLTYQTAMQSLSGSFGITAKTAVSADQQTLRITVEPNFRVAGTGPARVELPLIPGGTKQ